MQQAIFLGDSLPPVFAIIARVVRVDRKLLGYQLVAYLDRPTSRVQIIVVSIAVKDNWKMCANGILLSKQEVAVRNFMKWVQVSDTTFMLGVYNPAPGWPV